MSDLYQPIPEGQHHAVIFVCRPLGLHPNHLGSKKQQYAVGLEFPNLRDGDRTRIYWLPADAPDDVNILACLVRAAGKTPPPTGVFEPESLLGANVFVAMTHRIKGGRTFSNVANFKSLPADLAPVRPTTPPDLDLPSWIKQKISKRLDMDQPLPVANYLKPEEMLWEPAPSSTE